MIGFPRLHEKVLVADRIGPFRVVRIDYGAQIADVMSLRRIGFVVKAVPLSDLQTLENGQVLTLSRQQR
jgi:hypothetical protein